LKIAQQLILHNGNITKQLPTTNDVDEYTFESNHAIKKLFQNEKSLGTLIKKELKQPAQPKDKAAVPMKMSTPQNINVKLSSDEDDCWITGITVSPQNQLFVADYNNNSIKMIDINSGAIKQLQLESSPWDITMVNRDTLAVTLQYSKTIQFISYSSNSLSLKNKLKIDGNCHGISHHQGKLAVTFLYPGKLQIMDLKGNIKIKVEKDSNGDNIFSSPCYVTTNSHSIYVSDKGNNAVLLFNFQGEMIGRNVDIGCPRGITLLDDGSFFVSGYLTKCIYRVSGDCKDRTTVLENESPQAVCLCAETSSLYISTNSNNTESNNIIKIYKMM
jgi:DNA-binding beta-propeller fold protein YncE